jgi:hypothetical protein
LPAPFRACTSKPIWAVAHRRNPAHRSIAGLEATGMVLRLGTNARPIDTGGHQVFAGNPGTQVVKSSGRDALTRLRDHKVAAAGFDHHTACYPGEHRITMGVTGDRQASPIPVRRSSQR